jgi:N-acetyl-gamma-glutamyl-phosphate reductase
MPGGFDAVILGAAGYGGGELLRYLLDHPLAATVQAVSASHGGQPLAQAHPGLDGFLEGGFALEADWGALAASERPVVFSAQAHGALARQLPALESAWAAAGLLDRLTLIDLSGDFRLDDPTVFEAAYGGPHPCPERLGDFIYGVPEAAPATLRGHKRIANPGCFATAMNLALLPLVGSGAGFVAIAGATGSSGSGAKAQEGTHHPSRAVDFRAYKALQHQHEAEVRGFMARLGWPDLRLAFVPHSAPQIGRAHV